MTIRYNEYKKFITIFITIIIIFIIILYNQLLPYQVEKFKDNLLTIVWSDSKSVPLLELDEEIAEEFYDVSSSLNINGDLIFENEFLNIEITPEYINDFISEISFGGVPTGLKPNLPIGRDPVHIKKKLLSNQPYYLSFPQYDEKMQWINYHRFESSEKYSFLVFPYDMTVVSIDKDKKIFEFKSPSNQLYMTIKANQNSTKLLDDYLEKDQKIEAGNSLLYLPSRDVLDIYLTKNSITGKSLEEIKKLETYSFYNHMYYDITLKELNTQNGETKQRILSTYEKEQKIYNKLQTEEQKTYYRENGFDVEAFLK